MVKLVYYTDPICSSCWLAEPYLNKVLDLALQFELKKGKIEFLGISNFCTNKKGQYEGNRLNALPEVVEKRILEFAD